LSEIFDIVRMKSSLKSSSHHGRTRFLAAADAASPIGGGASGLAPGTMTSGSAFAGTVTCSGAMLVFTVAVDRLGDDTLPCGFGAIGGGGANEGTLDALGRIGGGGALGEDGRGIAAASTETTSSGEISDASDGSEETAGSISTLISSERSGELARRGTGGTRSGRGGVGATVGARAAISASVGRRGEVTRSSGGGSPAALAATSVTGRWELGKRLSSKTISGNSSDLALTGAPGCGTGAATGGAGEATRGATTAGGAGGEGERSATTVG